MSDIPKGFKPIRTLDGYYASKDGEIGSTRKGYFRVISQHSDKGGYRRFTYRTSDKSSYKHMLSHRAVLLAHRGLPPEGFAGSHLNGDRTDNRLSNLVWESYSDNLKRREDHGTMIWGERCGRAKLTVRDAIEIKSRYVAGEQIRSIAKDFPVSETMIGYVCNGKNWSEAIDMEEASCAHL